MRDSPPDWPFPGTPRSYTVTDAPRSSSPYAVERPTIPAPMTATSEPCLALVGRSVAGADRDADVGKRQSLGLGQPADAGER